MEESGGMEESRHICCFTNKISQRSGLVRVTATDWFWIYSKYLHRLVIKPAQDKSEVGVCQNPICITTDKRVGDALLIGNHFLVCVPGMPFRGHVNTHLREIFLHGVLPIEVGLKKPKQTCPARAGSHAKEDASEQGTSL